MTQQSNTLFIVSESGHVAEALVQARDGATVVCFDYLVERELRDNTIPFVSLRDIVSNDSDVGAWWQLTHDIARDWYRIPTMSFFAHEGIRIAEATEPLLQAYLSRLFYYVRVYLALAQAYPHAEVQIPAPHTTVDENGDFLAPFHAHAIIAAARMARLTVRTSAQSAVPQKYPFPRPTAKTFLLWLYNFFLGCLPRKGSAIYTSAYWTHFEPVEQYLTDTEFLVWETKRFYAIPWRILLNHRMRFMRSHDAITAAEEREARRIAAAFEESWRATRGDVALYLESVRGDLDWNPLLEVFGAHMTYAPRVVADIRTLRSIMERTRPDLVLVMAAVGGPQHYFFLMAQVAKRCGIPSVELQHAGATVDPRSVFSRIETDYLLTYGGSVNAWHARLGHDTAHLFAVGSPRFDQYVNERQEGAEKGRTLYREMGLATDRPVLFVAVPFSDTYSTALDSYQLAEFVAAMSDVQKKVAGLQILFKCRAGRDVRVMQEHVRGVFTQDVAVSGSDDIFSLICASTAAVCNNSTVIYQVMLAEKPLVLCPWKDFDTYHEQVYTTAAPLLHSANEAVPEIARVMTDALYRDALLARQKQFLAQYAFDGKSAERVAGVLKNIMKKKSSM